MLASNTKRKKIQLNLDQKKEICNYYQQNPEIKQCALIIKFNVKFDIISIVHNKIDEDFDGDIEEIDGPKL